MKTKVKILLMLAALMVGNCSFAGTVITNNLPPDTIIVNIASTLDYAASFQGDKAHWYSPSSALGPSHLLQYTFQPGTYTFRVVDPADAAQLFPALTSAQLNQIFTAWTFNSPWVTSYTVFDSSATNDSAIPQLFDGASGTNFGNGGVRTFGDPQSAYNAVVSDGSYQLIRTGPAGYDSLNFTNRYTITNTETLVFVVPDQGPGDNNGGVSVVVTQIGGLSVNWFKVAGGGGASSDGTLTIKGTAGQPDAGAMSDGTLTVKGGFWNVSVFQIPGLPYLTIQRIGANSVQVSWLAPATNTYTLQQNSNLANTAGWTTSGYTVTSTNGTNSITITPPTGNLFFRLKQ